jgi:hypothetical protein
MYVSIGYLILAGLVTGAGSFFAGCFYGNKLALDAMLIYHKGVTEATAEIKKARGEIVQFVQNHLPKL